MGADAPGTLKSATSYGEDVPDVGERLKLGEVGEEGQEDR